MAVYTAWSPIATDATYVNPSTGETEYSWKWVAGNDDEVPVDVSASLATGEDISGQVSTKLVMLKSTSEADDTLTTGLLQGAPVVVGGLVKQRMADLDYPRVYRLHVTIGPAGNRRTITAVIEVVA
jgi:hypothetical protein